MLPRLTPQFACAEALLKQFTHLARATDGNALLGDFVRGLAELSGCELTQLYLLDATHSCLSRNAEYFHGVLQDREAASQSADYSCEPLLQLSLRQNRVVCLADLNSSLQDSSFLPEQVKPWQSLLCVPIVSYQHAVEGLMVCASRRPLDLQGVADSFARLGSFVLGQLHLLQRGRQPMDELRPAPVSMPSAINYGLTGKSASIRQTRSLIGKVLNSLCTVLLHGETGTGKEVAARAIHDFGPRRFRPFIVQNCAAFPENLLESELFGFRKGAFTGADRHRTGLFDAANGGTLMLDEIGDMPLSLQAKLLRVLQEGEIRPLGSNDTHKIDVRILAATHRDLAVLVREGKFREDLYYRLNQFPIELPSLRHREGDILELARHFVDKTCTLLQRDTPRWSDAVLAHLSSYAFPGNVRELKGQVERAVLLCEGDELQVRHFSFRPEAVVEDSGLSLRERLEQVERILLVDCLRKNGGNQSLSARELGLPRRTLLYRLARLKISLGDAVE